MLTEFLIMRSSVCVTADRTRPIIRNYSRSRRLALVFFSCCSRPTAVICSSDRCVSCRRRRLMSRSWPVYYFFSPILLPPGVGSCRLLCLRRSILSVVSLFLFVFVFFYDTWLVRRRHIVHVDNDAMDVTHWHAGSGRGSPLTGANHCNRPGQTQSSSASFVSFSLSLSFSFPLVFLPSTPTRPVYICLLDSTGFF